MEKQKQSREKKLRGFFKDQGEVQKYKHDQRGKKVQVILTKRKQMETQQ